MFGGDTPDDKRTLLCDESASIFSLDIPGQADNAVEGHSESHLDQVVVSESKRPSLVKRSLSERNFVPHGAGNLYGKKEPDTPPSPSQSPRFRSKKSVATLLNKKKQQAEEEEVQSAQSSPTTASSPRGTKKRSPLRLLEKKDTPLLDSSDDGSAHSVNSSNNPGGGGGSRISSRTTQGSGSHHHNKRRYRSPRRRRRKEEPTTTVDHHHSNNNNQDPPPPPTQAVRVSRTISQDSYAQFVGNDDIMATDVQSRTQPLDMDLLEDMIAETSSEMNFVLATPESPTPLKNDDDDKTVSNNKETTTSSQAADHHSPTTVEEETSNNQVGADNGPQQNKKEAPPRSESGLSSLLLREPSGLPAFLGPPSEAGASTANDSSVMEIKSVASAPSSPANGRKGGLVGSLLFASSGMTLFDLQTSPKKEQALMSPSGYKKKGMLRARLAARRKNNQKKNLMTDDESVLSALSKSGGGDNNNPSVKEEESESKEKELLKVIKNDLEKRTKLPSNSEPSNHQRTATAAMDQQLSFPGQKKQNGPASDENNSERIEKIISTVPAKKGVFGQLKRALSDRSFMLSPMKKSSSFRQPAVVVDAKTLDSFASLEKDSPTAETTSDVQEQETVPVGTGDMKASEKKAVEKASTTEVDGSSHSDEKDPDGEKRKMGTSGRPKRMRSPRKSRKDISTSDRRGRRGRRSKTPMNRRRVRSVGPTSKSKRSSPVKAAASTKPDSKHQTKPEDNIDAPSTPVSSRKSFPKKSSPAPTQSPKDDVPRPLTPKTPRRASIHARARKRKEGDSTKIGEIEKVRSIPSKPHDGSKHRHSPRQRPRKRTTVDSTETAGKIQGLFAPPTNARPSTASSDTSTGEKQIAAHPNHEHSSVDEDIVEGSFTTGSELETIDLLSCTSKQSSDTEPDGGDQSLLDMLQVPFAEPVTDTEQSIVRPPSVTESAEKEESKTASEDLHGKKEKTTGDPTDTVNEECARLRAELIDSKMRMRVAMSKNARLEKEIEQLKARLSEFISASMA